MDNTMYLDLDKRLATIERLLRELPEMQAAVLFQMLDEYQAARMAGQKASDIWEIASPEQRESQFFASAHPEPSGQT